MPEPNLNIELASPAALPPFPQLRTLGAQCGVVAMAGVHYALVGECSHLLAQRPQMSVHICWHNGRRGVLVASRWASRNAHTVASDSCDAVRPDSAHELPT